MERDQAIKFVHELLRVMISRKASDLFITAGFPPAFKVDGKMTPVSNQSLTPTHTTELARAIMNDKQAQEFEGSKECNFAISPSGIGRFRVNAFIQQGAGAMLFVVLGELFEDEALELCLFCVSEERHETILADALRRIWHPTRTSASNTGP